MALFDSLPEAEKAELERIETIIVDCAFKVHKAMGPGLLESVYERCMFHEMTKRGLKVRCQVDLPIRYDDLYLESGLRLDMLVEEKIIVENKAVERIIPVFDAQIISYLKLAKLFLGFRVNYHVVLIKDGIKRFIR